MACEFITNITAKGWDGFGVRLIALINWDMEQG
jgi:hypothetical protein